MKNVYPIFSIDSEDDNFRDFDVTHIPNFYEIKELLDNWIKELKSGKLDTLKEVEVKSRFVTDVFGRILGFIFNHSEEWSLKEECKTKVDATVADATLGFFTKDRNLNDVRAVIEIKNAVTDLDAKQKRPGGISPVDQAFAYALGMGSKCKWVIVSNFKETRFYAAGDKTKYQTYLLKDFDNLEVLKEFIFFFHKDNFIMRDRKSKTEVQYDIAELRSEIELKALKKGKRDELHVIDKMYNSLKRFEEFGYVDPHYLCTLYPFNILEEHVWHFDNDTLFTINKEVYGFLNEIEVIATKIVIADNYSKLLVKQKVNYFEDKINWIFNFLNKSGISNLTAIKDYEDVKNKKGHYLGFSVLHAFPFSEDQGVTKNIFVRENKTCDCMSCNFRGFEFKKLFTKLKQKNGSPEHYDAELAYGNYLASTNDYKTAYTIYRSLDKYKSKENKALKYYLAKLNLITLHNLIRNNYDGNDCIEILQYIRKLDIDMVIHNELESIIDKDVRKYLIHLKEEKLYQKVKKNVQKTNTQINALKKLYENHGQQTGGLNLVHDMLNHYFELYLHTNRNFIVNDTFTDYREVMKEVFSGTINNFLTPRVGIKALNAFLVQEAIIHVDSNELKTILEKVKEIRVIDKDNQKLLDGFSEFFKSFYDESAYSFGPSENQLMAEFASSYSLKQKLYNIAANIFTILSKLELSPGQLLSIEPLIINFLKLENILYWNNIDRICDFIKAKGDVLSEKFMTKILEIAIKRDKRGNNKYERLVSTACNTIAKHFTETVISDTGLILKAISNCYYESSNGSDFRSYIYLIQITDQKGKDKIINAIDESLDIEFNPTLYNNLLRYKIYSYEYKNYFPMYVSNIAKTAGRSIQFKDGDVSYSNTDFTFFNFAMMMHNLGIAITDEQKNQFQNRAAFDQWLLDPENFNKEDFQAYWLKAIDKKSMINKVRNIQYVEIALKQELKNRYDELLGKIYLKHFLVEQK